MRRTADTWRVRRTTVRALVRAWLVALAVTLACAAAIAAHAAWTALHHRPAAHLSIAVPPRVPPATDDAQDLAAPAAGVTGTTALPPPPPGAPLTAGDAGIVSARPFSLAGIGASDRGRALECLGAAIYYEAASESIEGQEAVAQVVLNRVRHPAFPATVCGVVYQGAEHAGCQFSFACDGAMRRPPAPGAWARANRIAVLALNGYVFAPVGLATHYHTYAVTPAWNRSLVMTAVVGAHFFHRWKGYWGTASAFDQVYRGGEPVPGVPLAPPVPSPDQPPPVVIEDGAAAAGTVLPVRPVDPARPKPGDAAPLEPPVAPVVDHLPPASQVRDAYRNSGQPIVPERRAATGG